MTPRVCVILFLLFESASMAQTTKWYLSPDYLEDPEHTQRITAAQKRAAGMDEAGIRKVVDSLLNKEQADDDYWTLAVLEERAVPALVASLDDPRFAQLEETFPGYFTAEKLQRLWIAIERYVPESSVTPLTKLVRNGKRQVRQVAAMALGSLGKPSTVEGLKLALHDAEHEVRTWALIGIGRAMAAKRLNAKMADLIFDDVAAIVDLPSVGGTDAPAALLAMDEQKAIAFLIDLKRFNPAHREISSILKALAQRQVKVPADRVIALLDAKQVAESSNTMIVGYALQLLALAGDPSAEARIEAGMKSKDSFLRGLSADAYLILKGIPDAYQIAISKWSPEGAAKLPEPLRVYTTVHVLNNEISNGGIPQYFFNNSGDNAAEALAGLQALGATRGAAILQQAMALFGKDGPSKDRDVRQKQLDGVDGSKLDQLGESFLEDKDHFTVLLAKYAVLHAEYFKK